MIKLIVLDLDRTLLRDDNSISQYTLDILRKCKQNNLQIAFATARSMLLTAKVVPEEFSDGYWVCSNGAEIYKDKKLISSNLISEAPLKQIIDYFQNSYPSMPLVLVVRNNMYANCDLTPILSSGTFGSHVQYETVDFSQLQLEPCEKLMFLLGKADKVHTYKEGLPSDCIITPALGVLGEITHKNASKIKGLQFVLNDMGLSFENVAAFGDDMSDIEMIRESKIGVAMGNAIKEVKENANYVTLSNNEDGVADFLKSHLLIDCA
ncbi:MAG: Cof-type HAD-IIB family hydrolase [Clostridia bacterium]|nr:Cof-type HAD-IIB family hydrolase [Clostridia bacterium]